MSVNPNTCNLALSFIHGLHIPQDTPPTKVEPVVVTASQFEEKLILIGTPSGYATYSSDASSSKEVSGSKKVSRSDEASSPATAS